MTTMRSGVKSGLPPTRRTSARSIPLPASARRSRIARPAIRFRIFPRSRPSNCSCPRSGRLRAATSTARVQQPSAALGANPEIESSEVSISEIHGTRYFLNSEGFKTVAPIQLASLTMFAEAQASDGMPVRETFTHGEARSPGLAVRGRTGRAGARACQPASQRPDGRRSARSSPALCCSRARAARSSSRKRSCR